METAFVISNHELAKLEMFCHGMDAHNNINSNASSVTDRPTGFYQRAHAPLDLHSQIKSISLSLAPRQLVNYSVFSSSSLPWLIRHCIQLPRIDRQTDRQTNKVKYNKWMDQFACHLFVCTIPIEWHIHCHCATTPLHDRRQTLVSFVKPDGLCPGQHEQLLHFQVANNGELVACPNRDWQ